jgi:drug/metabolite transporter (DMT)-like permease
MDLQAIAILIVAAIIHSIWNLLSKRSRDKQSFLWLAVVVASGIFLLPFLLLYRPIAAPGWGFIAVSGVLEAGYFALLGLSYQHGDLSLVYPLVRGTGILCVTILAYAFLGESLAPGGLAGIALILGGLYVLHLRAFTRAGLLAPFAALRTRPSQFALLTGIITGAATVLDKVGIRYVDPVLYIYPVFLLAGLGLAPYMLRVRAAAVRTEWRTNKGAIGLVAVGFMSAYLLVLFALGSSHAGYVSSVREMSVVFAALLGTLVLRESFGRPKVLGACLIFAGILAIALS